MLGWLGGRLAWAEGDEVLECGGGRKMMGEGDAEVRNGRVMAWAGRGCGSGGRGNAGWARRRMSGCGVAEEREV